MVGIVGARFDFPDGSGKFASNHGSVTKTENGQDFPAAAYAYVGNPTEPTTWKLRLWETASSKMTAAQVGRAMAALGAGFRGNKVQIPADARGAVVAKVRSAWLSTHPGKVEKDMPSMLRHSAPAAETMHFSQPSGMPPVLQDEFGRHMVRGLPVFKTGGFRDNQDNFTLWSETDLDQMVENYVALRESGVFPNVPVRSDHSVSADKVVGWIDNVYHDGEFLLADYEFTQPDAVDKYANGTYRNVSAEVGLYRDNNDNVYGPCLRGCAFVDLNAVEGLNNFSKPVDSNEPPENTPMAKFRISGVDVEDVAQVQAHIDKLEGELANPKPHAFRISGEEVSDFAEVQNRIGILETFRDESVAKGRDAFVDNLVAEHKLAAPQAESVKVFIKTLDGAQFETYKKSFDNAVAAPVFSAHSGAGNGAPAPAGGQVSALQADIDRCEAVVAQFRLAGDTEEVIAKTPSYLRLQTLRAQATA